MAKQELLQANNMKQILLAIQFLTMLPVRIRGEVNAGQMAASAAFFPFAGAVQSILMTTIAAASMQIFSPELTAGFVVASAALINGGLHLDGLSDTFDGIAVKSSGSREEDIRKRLSVMKDSSAGAIGVIALVLFILLKWQLLSSLLTGVELHTALAFIFLMPVISRWAMVVLMRHSKPAASSGLGYMFISNIDQTVVMSSTLITLGICMFTVLTYAAVAYAFWFIFMLIVIIFSVYVFSRTSVKFFEGRFGGLTGDHAGALCEAAELIILLMVNIWLKLYIL